MDNKQTIDDTWSKYHDLRAIDSLRAYLTQLDLTYYNAIEYYEGIARNAPFDPDAALHVIIAKAKYKDVHKIVQNISKLFDTSS